MTHQRVLVQATATLDGTMREFKDWTLEPNQTITMLKARYDDPLQKPNYGYRSFTYKFID